MTDIAADRGNDRVGRFHRLGEGTQCGRYIPFEIDDFATDHAKRIPALLNQIAELDRVAPSNRRAGRDGRRLVGADANLHEGIADDSVRLHRRHGVGPHQHSYILAQPHSDAEPFGWP